MTIKAKTRKIIKLGDSLVVSLPSDFVKKSELRKGNIVSATYDDGVLLILNPKGAEKHEEVR